LAEQRIEEILKRGKLPIIAGGTGFYIEAIVEGTEFPEVKPNKVLREELERKTVEELFEVLEKKDPMKAGRIDPQNKRRLIRAIEIAEALGANPEVKKNPKYNVLQIGIEINDEKLKEKIETRIDEWIKVGLIEEGKKLQKSIPWERFNELGLEYKLLGQFLREEISQEQMTLRMGIETFQYAKRQRTWFKRDKRIRWFKAEEIEKIQEEVKKFL